MNVIRFSLLCCLVITLYLAVSGCSSVGTTTRSQAPTPTPTPVPSPTTTPTPFPTPTPIVTPTPMPTPTPFSTTSPKAGAAFLFVGDHGSAENNGGSVTAFRIASDGRLSPLPGSPFTTESGVAIVRGDPLGRFVFIGGDRMAQTARKTGCSDDPGILSVAKVNPLTGALTPVSKTTLQGSCVGDIAIDPSGTHLYVGMRNITTSGGSIQGFLIGPTGTLTELPGSPVIVEDRPISLAMHPSGRFLFAAAPDIIILNRDAASGSLTVRNVFGTPRNQLVMDPSGALLASEQDTSEISQFIVDGEGNIHETIPDQPSAILAGFQNGSKSPSVADPTGKFLYIVTPETGMVASFALDRNSGRMTAIAKPVFAGRHPASITIVQPH